MTELEKRCRIERNNFLDNLAFLRKEHNLTQIQMAELLGIGITSWRMIERGIMPPRLSSAVVCRVNEVFGIPAEKLFCSVLSESPAIQ